MARRQLGQQTGIQECNLGWRYGFVEAMQLMRLPTEEKQRRVADVAKSHPLTTPHPHRGSALYTSHLRWDSTITVPAFCRATFSGEMGKAGPTQYLWPLQSSFSCKQEARVIEMLALGLTLVPLPCTFHACHTKQLIIYKHPRIFQACAMLGPLPGMPFPYLLDLANLTHCSTFSS